VGSFTQGGMALGQGIGQGIKTYKEKKNRRDHNASKALAIRGQFDDEEEAGTLSAANSKLHKQLQNLEDLGSKKIESLVAEYETGEEMKFNSMKGRLLQYQVDDAEAKAQSRQGLADFAGKGYVETEAGFEGTGDYGGAIPTWDQRELLDKGEAYPVFPGELNPIYEEQPVDPSQFIGQGLEGASEAMKGNSYFEEMERRRAGDDEWFKSGQMEPTRAEGTNPSQGYAPEGAVPLWALGDRGEVQYSQNHYDAMFGPAAAEENQRQSDHSYYTGKLEETIGTIADMESRSKTPSRDFAWYNKELENKDMYERLIGSTSQQQAPSPMHTEKNPWPRAQAGEEGLDPVVIPNTMADAPPLKPEADEPAQTQQKLVGYDVTGGRDTPTDDDFDRMLTGGTPDTPMDERRGQLIDSLAQYNLTPTDRKQAIDMLSEKYPKLREFATEVVTTGGKTVGYSADGTFVKLPASSPTPQGWQIESITEDSSGKKSYIYKNPKTQPTYVSVAKKIAESDPELTLLEENTMSAGEAKEFKDLYTEAEDASHLLSKVIDMVEHGLEGTKPGWFAMHLTDRDLIGAIKATITPLKGKLRLPLIGPGAVSEYEQEILAEAIADPTKIFSLESANLKKLRTLKAIVERSPKIHGDTLGLFRYSPIGAGGQSGVGGTGGDPLGKYSK
jgi:hypothetical protein